MSRLQFITAAAFIVSLQPTIAPARLWTDSTGQYTVDADLVAFNDNTVVLQRKDDKELGAVPIEKLSQADREFLQIERGDGSSQQTRRRRANLETQRRHEDSRPSRDYARKDITLQRRRGRIYVNDRVFENLPEMYQLMLPKIVAPFERINQPDRSGLESWLVRQKGAPRTFTIDGVIMELENGDEYVLPFFFFSNEDLQVLQPGWETWLACAQGKKYDEQANQRSYCNRLRRRAVQMSK